MPLTKQRQRLSNEVKTETLIDMGLPEFCYVAIEGNPKGKRIGLVKRGETGYRPFSDADGDADFTTVEEVVVTLNDRIGVNKTQAMAMKTGSMFGWHVPGANPNSWVNRT